MAGRVSIGHEAKSAMIFAFDDFELDAGTRELRRGSQVIETEPQVFQLLQLLIENADRAVSRDEIFQKVWQGRFISDAALSSRISLARAALGDSGKKQLYIKTVPKLGFRFVGKLNLESGEAKIEVDPKKLLPDLNKKPSVAVMPFKVRSDDQNDHWFAEGLTSETISNLARFRNLFVFSGLTSKALERDLEIGKSALSDHGVDFLVEGTVQKTAKVLRVKVNLIGADDEVLLSEHYDAPATPDAMIDIQENFSWQIANRIGDQHGPIGQFATRTSKGGRSKLWQTYYWTSRFHQYYAERNPAVHPQVKEGLLDALTRDPGSSDACAALAMVYVDEYRLPFHSEPKPELLTEALGLARKATQLESDSSFS